MKQSKEPVVSRTAPVQKILDSAKRFNARAKEAPIAVEITKPKKPSFWEDDDDAPVSPPVAAQKPAATSKPTSKPAKNVPAPLPEVTAIPLEGCSIVFCGSHPVLILGPANATWSDVMCWHMEEGCSRHLLRADLTPKQAVDDTISFLQQHVKAQPNKK